jgi:dihydroorotase
MPNLTPPITTTAQALEYKRKLQQLSPNTEFLMTLYLNPSLTPNEIEKAAANGISGVKSYPRGVTTNSDEGIESYTVYYPIFTAMQKHNMVLNLHGEIPSDPNSDICVLNAESKFLKHLIQLHKDFPSLKIVLEHATSKDAVECVKSLGDSVGCSITIHHLELTVDDWTGCCHNFCKPVAKYPSDREALRNVIKEGNPKFFLGTDSAPHPKSAKEGPKSAAGVFVTPYLIEYLASILDSFGAIDRLDDFASKNGRRFYGIEAPKNPKILTLQKVEKVVGQKFGYKNDLKEQSEVVPFLAGKTLAWSIKK